jgi:Fe2+ transport system protein FeoA
MLMLRSLGFLESCSLRILTCDELHDLLIMFLMNFTQKYSFKRLNPA